MWNFPHSFAHHHHHPKSRQRMTYMKCWWTKTCKQRGLGDLWIRSHMMIHRGVSMMVRFENSLHRKQGNWNCASVCSTVGAVDWEQAKRMKNKQKSLFNRNMLFMKLHTLPSTLSLSYFFPCNWSPSKWFVIVLINTENNSFYMYPFLQEKHSASQFKPI